MNDNNNTFTVQFFSGETQELTLEELKALKKLDNVNMVWATTWEDECNWEMTPVSLLELGFPETNNTLLNSVKTKNKEKELALSAMLRNMEALELL